MQGTGSAEQAPLAPRRPPEGSLARGRGRPSPAAQPAPARRAVVLRLLPRGESRASVERQELGSWLIRSGGLAPRLLSPPHPRPRPARSRRRAREVRVPPAPPHRWGSSRLRRPAPASGVSTHSLGPTAVLFLSQWSGAANDSSSSGTSSRRSRPAVGGWLRPRLMAGHPLRGLPAEWAKIETRAHEAEPRVCDRTLGSDRFSGASRHDIGSIRPKRGFSARVNCVRGGSLLHRDRDGKLPCDGTVSAKP